MHPSQVHGQAEVQAAVRSLDAAAAKAAGEALAKVAASKDGLAMLNRVQPAAAAAMPQADAPQPGHAAAAPMHAAASRGQAAQCATRPAQPAQAPVQAAAGGMAGPEVLLAVSEKKDERARRCDAPTQCHCLAVLPSPAAVLPASAQLHQLVEK